MMYRHSSQRKGATSRRGRRSSRRRGSWRIMLLLVLVATGCIYAFINHQDPAVEGTVVELFTRGGAGEEAVASAADADELQPNVVRTRLDRAVIPPPNFNITGFRELFNDSNYVQLSAARHCGINPHTLTDPSLSDELVPIASTDLYQVDTMYHAVPYLVPEAALLVHYITLRFRELMAEHYPSMKGYKCVLTSALRTEESERRLRRVNRNATDTSCHIYGTTFDLSAQRFEAPDGRDTVVEPCRQMLALALYEIRYEGLCYVKYERGSCFHITLRTTQYEGDEASHEQHYYSPGSPEHQLTKSAPRPKPPVVTQPAPRPAPVVRHSAPTRRRQAAAPKRSSKSAAAPKAKSAPKSAATPKQSKAVAPAATHHQPVTERERLSLEQYERRY